MQAESETAASSAEVINLHTRQPIQAPPAKPMLKCSLDANEIFHLQIHLPMLRSALSGEFDPKTAGRIGARAFAAAEGMLMEDGVSSMTRREPVNRNA
jgi:hypothetical protein